MKKAKLIVIFLLCTCTSVHAQSLFFNTLIDYDTTVDEGFTILQKAGNSNIYILGLALDVAKNRQRYTFQTTDANGVQILNKPLFENDSQSFFSGHYGNAQHLGNDPGKFILPLTIQTHRPVWPHTVQSGFFIADTGGQVLSQHFFGDTASNFDDVRTLAMLDERTLLLGGIHTTRNEYYNRDSIALTKCDTSGNLIWRKYLIKDTGKNSMVHAIIPLANNEILLGATSITYPASHGQRNYFASRPWFIRLDSSGNLLWDTLLSSKYVGGGRLIKDVQGGFLHWGVKDSMHDPDEESDRNFPVYIMHLSESFQTNWKREFVSIKPAVPYFLPRSIRQLSDGHFLAIGIHGKYGWALKLHRATGAIMWEHDYPQYDGIFQYFNDGVEREDKSLVFCGSGVDNQANFLALRRQTWILGTDSNGCPAPQCALSVPGSPVLEKNGKFTAYPNPAYGAFKVNVPTGGTVVIYDMRGARLAVRTVHAAETVIHLPEGCASGLYVLQYTSDDGLSTGSVRLIYQP